MDAKAKLKDIAKRIDIEVEKALKNEMRASKNISPLITELMNQVFIMPTYGGKRLRGSFLYYSYLMHGGKNLKEALKITAFIELVHAYLLIHDDIMDQAPLRRGFKTIHNVYKEAYRNVHRLTNGELSSAAKHFGESIAINAGDILSHIGTNILVNADFPAENKIRALNKFNRNITDTGYGQVIDVFGEFENVDEEYVLQVHQYKTGFYTYETPLHVGAILAGASKEDLNHLTKYAVPGGIAFQIQDDLIDTFSDDAEKIGKTPGTDIKEGKKTLLIVKAYENASQKDKVLLDNALGNSNLDTETLETVRKIIVDTGSYDYSKKLAEKLLKKSTKAIQNSTNWDNEGRDFLIGINDYMLHRDL